MRHSATTPPRSTSPSWFHSPAQRQQQQPPRSSGGLSTHSHRADHDAAVAVDASSDAAGDGFSDNYDDDDDVSDREREPLLSPHGHAAYATAAALSPSTGSSSLLRRSFRGGVRAKRSCTDMLFLALFIAYWLGMLALGVFAFTRESNVSFAKYIKDGIDFHGRACGNNRFVYFPDYRANPDFGVCVDACPATAGDDLVVDLPLLDVKHLANETLMPVTFKSYATHAWTYVCAPVEGSIVRSCEELRWQ